MSSSISHKTFILASALTIIAGCESAGPAEQDVEFIGNVAVHDAGEDRLTASIGGQLEEKQGCLILRAGIAGEYLPLFPKDEVTQLADGVVYLRDTPLIPGQEINLGGGEYTPTADSAAGKAVAKCGVTKLWSGWYSERQEEI